VADGIPVRIAGRPELARPRGVSIRRIAGWSLLGSVAVILVALAARPEPIGALDARVERVLELYGKGDRHGARLAVDELRRDEPSDPRVWLLLGMLAEDAQAIADAESAYGVALGLLDPGDSRHTDVRVTLADLRRRKGDPSRALSEVDGIARERGETSRTRHARVLALADLGRLDEALSEARLIAEERFGGGVARKLEKQIRELMKARSSGDG
jgi:hypothetical protein